MHESNSCPSSGCQFAIENSDRLRVENGRCTKSDKKLPAGKPSKRPPSKYEWEHKTNAAKRAHPEEWLCACGNVGSVFKCGEIICARCREIEKKYYNGLIQYGGK